MVNTEIRLIISFAAKDEEALYSQQKQDRADGSDNELLIAKFRLKLNKVGKTNIWFRYDQNQIHYDYTVEVTNKFKGLDMIDKVPEELWTEVHDIVQENVIETILKKKKMQNSKIIVWWDFTNSCEKKRCLKQRKKERYTHLNAEFQRIEKRDKKTFSVINAKK